MVTVCAAWIPRYLQVCFIIFTYNKARFTACFDFILKIETWSLAKRFWEFKFLFPVIDNLCSSLKSSALFYCCCFFLFFFFLEQGFSASLTSHKTTLELSEHTRFGRDLNGDLSLSPSFFAVIGFFLNFKKNNAASKVFLRQSCRLPITIIFSILS